MATKLQHITAALMAMLLLVSSIGVPVNEHFCRMSNISEVSLLPIIKSEIKSNEPAACCSKSGKKSCCTALQTASTQKQQTADKNCCSDNSEYIYLETDMLISGFTKVKMPVSSFYFFVPYLFYVGSLTTDKVLPSQFFYTQKPSLTCSLQVCTTLQVFLC